MVDLMRIARLAVLVVGMLIVYAIASAPGWGGKLLAAFIIGIVVWYYMRRDAKREIMNPVTRYYENLALLCRLNRAPSVGRLIMEGDGHNQAFVKGLIIGGPVSRYNKKLLVSTKPVVLKDKDGKPVHNKDGTPVMSEETAPRKFPDSIARKYGGKHDPRTTSYVFLYTPQYGGIYNLPVLGGLFARMWRKEYLFCAYAHQLESPDMIGDIVIRGVNTKFIGMMEFVNDFTLEPDIEMTMLDDEVQRLTLTDQLSRLPLMIRSATDANSSHLRTLDTRDDVMGR